MSERGTRATRYDMRVVCRARELREAGWSHRRIQDLIADEFGTRPTRDTVLRWTNASYAERRAARGRVAEGRRVAAAWRFQVAGRDPTPEYKAAFARRLRGEGVPVPSIAKVFRVVFDDADWSSYRIRRLLSDAACIDCDQPASRRGGRCLSCAAIERRRVARTVVEEAA